HGQIPDRYGKRKAYSFHLSTAKNSHIQLHHRIGFLWVWDSLQGNLHQQHTCGSEDHHGVHHSSFRTTCKATYKVKLVGPDGDHENEFDAPVDCYILDAANSAGVELPYSCQICVIRRKGIWYYYRYNKDKKETYATKVIDFDLVMQTTKAETHDSEACLNEGTCFPVGWI
ncbi:ferredoxin, root R-B1-like protein, partial [Tanacetum coccineum]